MNLRKFAAALGTAVLAAGASGAGAAPLYDFSILPAGFAAEELNNAGQVVGTANGAAAILSGNTLTSLAAVAPVSFGLAINGAGDVAGALGSRYGGDAFSYIGATLTNLGPLLSENFYYSYATAITDGGAVGGVAVPFVGEAVRGFIQQGGSIDYLGTLGGDFSQVAALNGAGAATGVASLEGPALVQPYHAIYYAGGVLQDLGTLGGASGEAHAINNLGAIVGNAYLAGDAILHAFLYLDGQMIDLNGLVDQLGGWELTAAYDINDAGQILGTACQAGECTSVLLSPVPEPATGALLLAGLGVLALSARACRRGGAAAPPLRTA